MFDKLEAVESRYEELTKQISDPEIIANQVEELESFVFNNCYKIKSITLGKNINKIEPGFKAWGVPNTNKIIKAATAINPSNLLPILKVRIFASCLSKVLYSLIILLTALGIPAVAISKKSP